MGQILSCLADQNSGVFVYTSNAIYSIDSTGKLSWKTTLEKDTNINKDYTVRIGIKSNEKTLIVPRDNGDVISVATNNGQLLWQGNSGNKAPVFHMGIDQTYAYVARHSSEIVAYDTNIGQEVWFNPVPDRTSLYVFPIEGKVYLGTSYELFEYDAQTGDLLLDHKLDGFVEKIFIDAR